MSDMISKFKQAEKIIRRKRFEYISSNLQGKRVLIFWKDEYMYFRKHVVYTLSFNIKYLVLGYLIENKECKSGYDVAEAVYADNMEEVLSELRSLGNFVENVHSCTLIYGKESEDSCVLFDSLHKEKMILKCGEKSKTFC